MTSYKAEVTLNEKDSILDLLALEKSLVKIYATALTEGVSQGFRRVVKENFEKVAHLQAQTFFMLTEQGYYKVCSAKEEKLKEICKIFKDELNNLDK